MKQTLFRVMSVLLWTGVTASTLPAQDEPPPSEVKIVLLGVKRDRDRKHMREGDPDDQTQNLAFEIKFENPSLEPVAGLQLEFTVVGECFVYDWKGDDLYAVLKREKLPLDLAGGEVRVVGTTPFEVSYDTTDAKFGARYFLYFLEVRDAKGRLVMIDTDKSAWLDKKKDIDAMKLRRAFNKKVETQDVKLVFRDS
jgi:hypothetical protein